VAVRKSPLIALAAALALVAGAVIVWRVSAHDHTGPGSSGHGAFVTPDPTVRSVADGDWSDPATWSTGRVPARSDDVLVEHDVRYDAADGQVRSLQVRGGTIDVARDRDTSLTLDNGNLLVLDGGVVQVGARDAPIPGAHTATIAFRVRDEQAFVGGFEFEPTDTGLWVLDGGRLELHGAPVRETWTKIAAPARPGDAEVVVAGDVNDWPAGSDVVVTGTNNGARDQSEQRRITGAEPAGGGRTRLTLEKRLDFPHAGSPATAGEVGLLSHNVLVTSVDPKNRAHVMFMGGSTGGVTYSEFRSLGPQDVKSRYALHFHLMGDASRGIVVQGNAFRDARNFWVDVHGSNGVTVADNVGFRGRTAGFFLEKVTGHGNAFVHNLGVNVEPSPRLLHRNSIFWFQLGNAMVGNVAVGATGGELSSGFFIPQAKTSENPGTKEPTVVLANEAHGNRNGFFSWMNQHPPFDVVDLYAWRNQDAGMGWGAYNTHFKAYRIRAADNGQAGVSASVKGFYLQDSELSGQGAGLELLNPFVTTSPKRPSMFVRGSLGGNGADVEIDDRRDCEGRRHGCSALYVDVVDATLASTRPARFAWQWNEDTAISFVDVRTPSRPDLPPSFVLRRGDIPQPSDRSIRDPEIGSWVVPEGEPGAIDLPPAVGTPRVGTDLDRLTVSVRVADDESVKRVEVLVNGAPAAQTKGTDGVVTLDVPVDGLLLWTWITVRATDSSGNVTYSPSVPVT